MPKLRDLPPDPTFRQVLAVRLQQLRQDHGTAVGSKLSQIRFAALLGIAGDTLGSYERGDREPPLAVLIALRRVTGLSIDRLLTDLDERPPAPPADGSMA